MTGRRNCPAQAEKFEELHLSDTPTFDGVEILIEREDPEPERNPIWFDDDEIDLDNLSDEDIADMIEVLEKTKPSGSNGTPIFVRAGGHDIVEGKDPRPTDIIMRRSYGDL